MNRAVSDVVAAPRVDTLFDGPGEMRALCRAFDWSTTSLGPIDTWPLSLRTTVATLLASRYPMFLFWGPDLIQFYNDAYRPSLAEGGRHPRALGMRGSDFWTEIWHIIGPQIDQVMAGGEATWHEDHLVPIERNGRIEEVYWTYSYGPAFDDDGHVGGVLVVCQETTPRVFTERRLRETNAALAAEREAVRASEAKYRALFESIDTGFCVVQVLFDANGAPIDYRFLETNPAFAQQTGLVDAVGRTAREIRPSLEQEWIDVYGRVAMTGESRRFEQGSDVMGRWFDVFAFRVGRPEERRVAILFTDVSAQIQARREIERLLRDSEQARADAEEARGAADAANRAKSEFLAVMSHELRTPLNAIGGYAELIELGIHGPVTAAQQEALRRIQKSERHLLGLVNGVLNYARIETGNIDYRVSDVALDEVLATCEALVLPQARARQLTLSHDHSGANPIVRVDPDKLQQIVLNMLSNAVKFTEPGGTVTLTREAVDDLVYVRVRDTGLGIPAEQLTRIFEPFVQVDARLTRGQEGVGLGLAISRDLARGMGGDLTVESELGVGSTFTLALDRAP